MKIVLFTLYYRSQATHVIENGPGKHHASLTHVILSKKEEMDYSGGRDFLNKHDPLQQYVKPGLNPTKALFGSMRLKRSQENIKGWIIDSCPFH
jgi:hypothetical protein